MSSDRPSSKSELHNRVDNTSRDTVNKGRFQITELLDVEMKKRVNENKDNSISRNSDIGTTKARKSPSSSLERQSRISFSTADEYTSHSGSSVVVPNINTSLALNSDFVATRNIGETRSRSTSPPNNSNNGCIYGKQRKVGRFVLREISRANGARSVSEKITTIDSLSQGVESLKAPAADLKQIESNSDRLLLHKVFELNTTMLSRLEKLEKMVESHYSDAGNLNTTRCNEVPQTSKKHEKCEYSTKCETVHEAILDAISGQTECSNFNKLFNQLRIEIDTQATQCHDMETSLKTLQERNKSIEQKFKKEQQRSVVAEVKLEKLKLEKNNIFEENTKLKRELEDCKKIIAGLSLDSTKRTNMKSNTNIEKAQGSPAVQPSKAHSILEKTPSPKNIPPTKNQDNLQDCLRKTSSVGMLLNKTWPDNVVLVAPNNRSSSTTNVFNPTPTSIAMQGINSPLKNTTANSAFNSMNQVNNSLFCNAAIPAVNSFQTSAQKTLNSGVQHNATTIISPSSGSHVVSNMISPKNISPPPIIKPSPFNTSTSLKNIITSSDNISPTRRFSTDTFANVNSFSGKQPDLVTSQLQQYVIAPASTAQVQGNIQVLRHMGSNNFGPQLKCAPISNQNLTQYSIGTSNVGLNATSLKPTMLNNFQATIPVKVESIPTGDLRPGPTKNFSNTIKDVHSAIMSAYDQPLSNIRKSLGNR